MTATAENPGRQQEPTGEELAAFLFHDLRAPIRAVDGFTMLLSEKHRDALPEEGREFVDMLREASGQLEAMVRDLVLLLRLKNRRLQIKADEVSMIRDRLQSELAPLLAQTEGALEMPASCPAMVGDLNLLHAALFELIDNGLRYHRAGAPPRVRVDCCEAAGRIKFSVADNGQGIPAIQQERIFVMGQRLHSRDEIPGTGLGLCIARRAAHLMDGELTLESEEGVGSTFILDLPAADGDSD